MAALFPLYKTVAPRSTILSADFNGLQGSLKASFELLGEKRIDAEAGVIGTFACADPTADEHAVTLGYLNTAIPGLLAPEQAAAQASADAAAASAALAASIRFEDALYLTFFFGTS